MSNIAIGTCVRHVPPRPHQRFIGSGVIFELDRSAMVCSIVLLDGRVIVDLPLAGLIDGSWVISGRTMTLRQIEHLLAHASECVRQDRMVACGDGSGCCGYAQGGRSQDLLQRVPIPAIGPESRQYGFSGDEATRSLDVATVDIEGD
ncbi:MAG: hypothetical protein K2X55_05805 [Burkholderiaceae bacterium]|nr:hypothetical protein [Burkholderiaceae bacterium]